MNAFEAKQERRRERLEAAAERAKANAAQAFDRADLREEKSGIPFGQPVLVGHHSERRHRAALDRADRAMRKGIEESKRAKDLAARAASVGLGGISSDDPAACQKIAKEIDALKALQARMAASNKIIRAYVKAGAPEDGFAAYFDALRATPGGAGITEGAARRLLKPDFCGRIGFADYELTNNGANIRRLQARLDGLRAEHARRARTPTEALQKSGDGWTSTENADENRLQIIFDGKPEAKVREALKSRGFRWAPSANAWQRQLNNAAREALRYLIATNALPASAQ